MILFNSHLLSLILHLTNDIYRQSAYMYIFTIYVQTRQIKIDLLLCLFYCTWLW